MSAASPLETQALRARLWMLLGEVRGGILTRLDNGEGRCDCIAKLALRAGAGGGVNSGIVTYVDNRSIYPPLGLHRQKNLWVTCVTFLSREASKNPAADVKIVGNTSNPFSARMPFVLAGKLVSGLKKSLPARKKTILAGASHQTPSTLLIPTLLPKKGYSNPFCTRVYVFLRGCRPPNNKQKLHM
jgi:hypothetical protein